MRNCFPGSSTPESTPPERAVTVCGAVSSLSNTTVAPLATVRPAGAKASPAIFTVPPAAAPAPTALGRRLGALGRARHRHPVGELVADDDRRAGQGQADHGHDDQRPDGVRAWPVGGSAHAPEFYMKPSRAASPARTIQITRAMATVSRNRYMARPRGRTAP